MNDAGMFQRPKACVTPSLSRTCSHGPLVKRSTVSETGMPERLVHQAQEVAGPRGADRHRAERVLEDQVPADDPGDELAHRRVAVGVGRAGDRDHRRHLRVAHAGQRAEHAADHEAVHDARAGVVGRRGAGEREDARADDRADAQHREVERRQRALELPAGVRAVGGFAGERIVGVGDELRQVFLDEQSCHVMRLRRRADGTVGRAAPRTGVRARAAIIG